MRLGLALAAAGALLAGCNQNGGKEAAAQPAVQDHRLVIFPANSPQLAQIVAQAAEPRREMTVRFNGRLVWNEDRTARVFPPFAGRVVSIAVRPGDRVRAGQTLVVLAAPDYGVAQADASRSEQDYALAQKNLKRIEELYNAGVSPAKDLQAAQTELARVSAERARTQARMKLYGKAETVDQQLSLASPIAGVVVERNLFPGQELRPDNQADKPLFVVSDPTKLWFMLDVSEKDIGTIKAGDEVKIGTTSLGEDHVSGRIAHVADLVDPATRTVRARGVIEAPDERLKAEMYIVAKLHLVATTGVLVPAHAIYLRGEQYFVFVDQGGGRFERRPVRPGPISEGKQVVLEGIAAGDRVVVDGNLLLERLLASKD